jgi:aspartate/tyrosine/aromatic aminotransferase
MGLQWITTPDFANRISMLTETASRACGLADLPPVNDDSLLKLIALCNADPRPEKIDVGVGVFRDGAGNTPILKVIKAAEQRLVDTQKSKSYLGSAGDKRFTELLRPILLGPHADDERIAGVQTPGGCGALRLGFQLLAVANRQARVFVGAPTWPNHPPIIRGVGLTDVEYPYYERGQGAIRFEDMIDALRSGEPGDIALLHGCCHNPTGADLDEAQWRQVRDVIVERGLIPFVDIAYQGFGRGLDEDAYGVRIMLDSCDEVIVAQMAREMWSMPPDHGAAAVRIVLDDPELRERWLVELAAMRDRINAVRQRIASADPRLSFVGRQFGMFSMLPLSKEQVLKLREEEAIYMADSGRFNVVGMGDNQIDRFIAAVVGALDA